MNAGSKTVYTPGIGRFKVISGSKVKGQVVITDLLLGSGRALRSRVKARMTNFAGVMREVSSNPIGRLGVISGSKVKGHGPIPKPHRGSGGAHRGCSRGRELISVHARTHTHTHATVFSNIQALTAASRPPELDPGDPYVAQKSLFIILVWSLVYHKSFMEI